MKKYLATLGLGILAAWLFLPASVVTPPVAAPSAPLRRQSSALVGALREVNRHLAATAIVILALCVGMTVWASGALAHNGVSHGVELIGAINEAQKCSLANGNVAPALYPTGTTADGRLIYLVDRSPTLESGLRQTQCWTVMYEAFNAITLAADEIPDHWRDRIEWALAGEAPIERELSLVLASLKYELTDDPTYDAGVFGRPQAGTVAENVDAGTPNEFRLARIGWVDLSDLNLIGSAPVD